MLLSPQGTAAVARVFLSFWSQTWSRWSLKKGLEKSSFWSDTAAHFLELVSPEQGSFTPSNARIPTPLTVSLLNRHITQHPAIMWVCHLQGLSEQGFEDPWMYVWTPMPSWWGQESWETLISCFGLVCDAWGSLADTWEKKPAAFRKTGFRGQGRNGKSIKKKVKTK